MEANFIKCTNNKTKTIVIRLALIHCDFREFESAVLLELNRNIPKKIFLGEVFCQRK